MPRTATKSKPKLTLLSKSLIQNLNPNGETDFWKFYLKYKGPCDRIIDCQLRLYVSDEENQKDIRQEVLMSLQRNNILTGYDPKNGAAFNTYFTSMVKGYVQWQLHKQLNHTYHPYSKNVPDGEDNNLRYKRVFYQALNGVYHKDQEKTPKDIPLNEALTSEKSLEDTLILKDILEIIRSKLSNEALQVYDLMGQGYTKKLIGEILNVKTMMAINNQTAKINAISSRVISY